MVRKLEEVYARIGDWRDRYYTDARYVHDRRRAGVLLGRNEHLADVQRDLAEVIYKLDQLRRLS